MAQPERVYEDEKAGTVILRKNSRSKRISLRVSPLKGVTVSMPYFVPYDAGLKFFMSKREWVLNIQSKQREAAGTARVLAPKEIERLREQAKEILPARLSELAGKYSFEYNSVHIKHNSSNWGSCSHKGNINLNLNLVLVPDELRDYVLIHELCHLRIPDHSPAFHSLLESLCPDHRRKEKELKKIRIF